MQAHHCNFLHILLTGASLILLGASAQPAFADDLNNFTQINLVSDIPESPPSPIPISQTPGAYPSVLVRRSGFPTTKPASPRCMTDLAPFRD